MGGRRQLAKMERPHLLVRPHWLTFPLDRLGLVSYYLR
jgi:hypothetical protein